MIREAGSTDIPTIKGMVGELHRVTRMALPIDDVTMTRSLVAMQASPQGLLLIAERGGKPCGFLAASIGYSAVSMAPVAFESGWWSEPHSGGAGLRLLIRYERWAKDMGCAFVRMCTPPHNEKAAQILRKRGFFISELCWVRAL